MHTGVCFHASLWLFLIKCLIIHMKVLEISCGFVGRYCFAERSSICFWQTARSSKNARLASCNRELKLINIWTGRHSFSPLFLISTLYYLPFKSLFQNVVFIGGYFLNPWLSFFSCSFHIRITCFHLKFLDHYLGLSNSI